MPRPMMPADERRVHVHMLLDPSTITALDSYCRTTGTTRTAVIEDAIMLHLLKRFKKPAEAVYGGKEEDRLAD